MLLLLLELVELLFGLGVAIVVLDSSSSALAAMQRVKLRPLSVSRRDTAPLERSSCTTATSVPLLPSRAVGNVHNHDCTAQIWSNMYANQNIMHFVVPTT